MELLKGMGQMGILGVITPPEYRGYRNGRIGTDYSLQTLDMFARQFRWPFRCTTCARMFSIPGEMRSRKRNISLVCAKETLWEWWR